MKSDLNSNVITIDCHYIRPQFAASFLVSSQGHTAIIETNTSYSVQYIMNALKERNLNPDQVDLVIITHVHLDHAGGAYALMEKFPRAILIAHPKAAIHMIDPSRLVSSARQVYGDQEFERLYGEIGPIDPKRVRTVSDGEVIQLGDRKLTFIYTRGHANHHFCVYDSGSNGVFTGDSFGLCYPALQQNGLFIFPSTSPTDFDPKEAKESLKKILATGAQRVFLTHFGELREVYPAAQQLKAHLDFSEGLLNQAIQGGKEGEELQRFCEAELNQYFQKVLKEKGLAQTPEAWDILKLDLELNAAGIAFQAKKRRKLAQ